MKHQSSYDRIVLYSTSYTEIRRHIYKMLHVSHHGHLYYTLRTKFPQSLLIYEHNAHAITLCVPTCRNAYAHLRWPTRVLTPNTSTATYVHVVQSVRSTSSNFCIGLAWVICIDTWFITSPPIGGGRGIVMPMSVCVFVCLCVCLFVCLCVCLSVFSAKFQSVISQPFLNRSL